MHATHLDPSFRTRPHEALLASLALFTCGVPAFAEELAAVSSVAPQVTVHTELPAPTGAQIETPAPSPAPATGSIPAPAASAQPAAKRQSEAQPYGLIFRQPQASASRSNLATPNAPSFEIAHSLPLINRLADVNLFSGLYSFNDGTKGNLSGIRSGIDLALSDRLHLEASMTQDPDLNRRNNFVGLWASIPLGNGTNRAAQSEDGPNRTLIASIGNEPVRHRTSRRADGDSSRHGFFSRFLSFADRGKPSPPATIAPLKESEPETADSEAAESAKSKGAGFDLLGWLRR
jgi:hypothetical protein